MNSLPLILGITLYVGTLAFSRVLHDQKTLYVFNSSTSHPKEVDIRVGTPSGTSPGEWGRFIA